MARYIASVKIDEDNTELMDDLIKTREFSKIVNYCLRAYRNKLILPPEAKLVMDALNVSSALELLNFTIKKSKQYKALQQSIMKESD